MTTTSTTKGLTWRFSLAMAAAILCGYGQAKTNLQADEPPMRPNAALADSSLARVSGLAALEDGLYVLAEKHFRARLNQPDLDAEARREALLGLIQALHGQGQHEAMATLIERERDRIASAPDVGVFLYWHAKALKGQNRADDAMVLLNSLATQHPNSAYRRAAERLTAHLYVEHERIEEALAAYARVDALPGSTEESAANLLEWGRTLVQVGRYPDALPVLARLTENESVAPQDIRSPAFYWLGRARLGEQRWQDALFALARVADDKAADDDLAGHAALAQASAYLALTNAPAALTALSNGMARARSPEIKRTGQAQLGITLLQEGQLDVAAPLIQAFVAAAPQAPESARLQLLLAETLLNHDKAEAAATEFQRYLEAFSDPSGQAQALAGRGWALYKIERFAEASAAFTRAAALSQDPDFTSRALFKAGDAYLASGQYDKASETYQRLAEAFPESPLLPQAMFQHGQSLAQSGSVEESLTLFLAVHATYPDLPLAEKALFRRAELLEQHDQPNEAVEALTQLLTAYPEGTLVAEAMLARGLLRYRLYKTPQALSDFEALVRRFPDTKAGERAFYMRGLCYFRLLRDQDMIDTLNAFLERYPQSDWAPQVMFQLAQHFYNQGNFENAQEKFLVLANTFEDHALADHAVLRAGHAAAQHKEYRQAMTLFGQLAKQYPESRWLAEARFGHAEALRQLGRYSEAILFYDDLRTRYADNDLVPMALMRRGDAQFMLGVENPDRYREALQSYRAVASDPAVERTQPALRYEAEYKIGRCLEKLDQPDHALDQYYAKVMIRFLAERDKGVRHEEAIRRWFERASMNAVDILEGRKDWRGVVAVLERALEAGVASSEDIRKKIQKIRSDHFWLFY